MRTAASVFLALLAFACALPPPPPVPPEAAEAFRAGNEALEAGREAEARAAYAEAARLAPHHAEAQAALLERVRQADGDALAREHARQVAAASPPEGLLLEGLLEADPERRTRLLVRALEARPTSWPAAYHLGLAWKARREHARALAAFERAMLLEPRRAEAHAEAGYCEFRLFRWRAAVTRSRRALELDPRAVAPRVFVAVDRLLRRDFLGAVEHHRELAKRHPGRPSEGEEGTIFLLAYRGALAELRAERSPKGLELAREAVTGFPRSGLMRDFLGWFTELAGDLPEALAHYRAALLLDPYRLETVQDLRRSLVRERRFREALDAWARIVPLDLLLRPDNEERPRWERLFRAALGAPVPAGPAGRERLLELGRALAAVGWLDEAASVLEAAREAEPAGPLGEEAGAELSRVASMRGFLRELETELRTHYRRLEKGGSDLSLSRLARRVRERWPFGDPPDLGRDLTSHYLVVEEADPFDVRKGSLAAALAPWGLAFDVGDNAGYLDMRLSRVLFRVRCEERIGGLPYRYRVVVTDETLVDNFLGWLSGHPRISGRAFLSRNGFYVAIDTFRPGLAPLQAFLGLPREAEPSADRVAYSPKLDAELRRRFLAEHGLAYPIEKPGRAELDRAFQAYLAGFLHNVWLHELGHLVDFERYVPFSDHFWSNVWLAIASGLSPAAIEQRFERVAETFSLALTRHPALSLQDNLDRLHLDPDSLYYMVLVAWQRQDPRESPYYVGAQRIFEALLDEVEAKGGGKAGGTGIERLAELDGDAIRGVARRLCRRAGLPFE